MSYQVFQTEQQFQAACVMWFNNEFPTKRKALHCNNNNSHDRRSGVIAKAVGVVSGVSDLELVAPGSVIFIELKLPGKKQSEDQIKFMNYVLECGLPYVLFEYIEDFKSFVCNIFGK